MTHPLIKSVTSSRHKTKEITSKKTTTLESRYLNMPDEGSPEYDRALAGIVKAKE